MPGGFLQANRKNADTPRKGALSFSQRGQELHATHSSAEGILGDTLCLISTPPRPAIQMKTPRTGGGVLSLVAGAGTFDSAKLYPPLPRIPNIRYGGLPRKSVHSAVYGLLKI